MKEARQDEIVRDFYDQDSDRYLRERYPEEARTCSQYSYLIRKVHVLRMLSLSAKGTGLLLDIGCGPGVYTKDLLELGWKVTGMDLSRHMIREAQAASARAVSANRAIFATGNVTRLPFRSSSFDCVLCIGVISYVDDIHVALSEISRVLRPSGTAIIQISNRASLFELGVRLRRTISRMLPGSRNTPRSLREQIHLQAYHPVALQAACRRAGLELSGDRYYDFSMPFISGYIPGPALWLARRLEALNDAKPFAWLGAGYLLVVHRTRQE